MDELRRKVDDVEDRLRAMEAKQERILTVLEGISGKMTERIQSTDGRMDRIDRTLFGYNGSIPGVMVELDRLKEAHKRSQRLVNTVVGAVMTLVVGAIWALIAG